MTPPVCPLQQLPPPPPLQIPVWGYRAPGYRARGQARVLQGVSERSNTSWGRSMMDTTGEAGGRGGTGTGTHKLFYSGGVGGHVQPSLCDLQRCLVPAAWPRTSRCSPAAPWASRGREGRVVASAAAVTSTASNGSAPAPACGGGRYKLWGTGAVISPPPQSWAIPGCGKHASNAAQCAHQGGVPQLHVTGTVPVSLSLTFPPCFQLTPFSSAPLGAITPPGTGVSMTGSLCALLNIKPSLFGYNIPNYSAASGAEVEQ